MILWHEWRRVLPWIAAVLIAAVVGGAFSAISGWENGYDTAALQAREIADVKEQCRFQLDSNQTTSIQSVSFPIANQKVGEGFFGERRYRCDSFKDWCEDKESVSKSFLSCEWLEVGGICRCKVR